MLKCDPVTGACVLPEMSADSANPAHPTSARPTVRYIGDPMCSWCWGIAPVIQALAVYCTSHQIDFTITVGGLRPGGGDEWNAAFKAFLRHEWQHIQRITSQPFSLNLLDEASFNYDTEPACRAVTSVSNLLADKSNRYDMVRIFFLSIQHKFYVANQDPKDVEFYRQLCQPVGISYENFRREFLSEHAARATRHEFAKSRSWGVRAFPSILLEQNGIAHILSSGYIDAAPLIARLEEQLGYHPRR